MTETELFVKMLDEKATNDLLKIFSPSTKNGNVEFKKVQLRKVFKGLQGNNIKKKKQKFNEFDIAINQFVNPQYRKRTKQELITIFGRDIRSKIPYHIKFANLYFYHTELVKEKLNIMNENFENKSNLCRGIMNYESIEEVENDLKSNMMFNISIKEKVCSFIKENLNEEDIIKFEEIKDIIYSWSLVDFYNNIIDLSEKYPIYLIQLQFLAINENKPEIENGISIEMLLNYYDEVNMVKFNQSIDGIEEVEKLKKEISQHKLEYEKLNNEYKGLNKKLQRYEKKEIELVKKNKKYEVNNNYYEEKNAELINELNSQKKLVEEVKLKNEEYKCRIIEEEQKNIELIIEVNEFKEKINTFEAYKLQACSIESSSKKEYEFVLICKKENILCRMFYPEILFIDSDEWENYFEQYKIEINKINKVYIQRCGLTNIERRKINRILNKNSINAYTINGQNEREILETIIKIKNNIKI